MSAPPATQVFVRRVRADEWRALRTLRLAALQDAPLSFERSHAEALGMKDDWWRAWAANGAEGGAHATFVAERGDALVGMSGTYADDDVEMLCLGAMWVAPEARGLGVGRALVEATLGWARDRGLARIGLWVNEDNEAARALYASCGFEETGRSEPQRWRPEKRVALMARKLP